MSKKAAKADLSAKAGKASSTKTGSPGAALGNAPLAAFLAWLFPGLGHLYLKQRSRALAFSALVLVSLLLGVRLDGKLLWELSGPPLMLLGTLGSMGSGLPFLIVGPGLGLKGDPTGAFFEYGGALILSAGLMNLLLILEVWDVASGRQPPSAQPPEADSKGEP